MLASRCMESLPTRRVSVNVARSPKKANLRSPVFDVKFFLESAGLGRKVVNLLLSDPHNHTNWGENAETFAIAGAAWILADLLGEYRP